MSVINNGKDPLQAGPEAARVLLERLAVVCNEFPIPVVIDAAANVLINAIRQNKSRRSEALAYFDQLFGKSKSVLDAHYDSVTGNRRNIFAHDQHVVMDLHKDPEGL